MDQAEVIRFFQNVVTQPCPGCGNNEFMLLPPNTDIQLVIDRNDGSFSIPFPHVKAIARTCQRCGNVTLHDAQVIAAWVAKNKKTGIS